MRTSPVAVLQNFFVLSFCSNPHKFYQFQLPVESVFNTKYTIVFSTALFKTTAPHVERQRRVRLRSGRPKPAHQSRDTAFYELIILFINCNLSIKARADDVRRGPRLARTWHRSRPVSVSSFAINLFTCVFYKAKASKTKTLTVKVCDQNRDTFSTVLLDGRSECYGYKCTLASVRWPSFRVVIVMSYTFNNESTVCHVMSSFYNHVNIY